MSQAYYFASIAEFLEHDSKQIFGIIAAKNPRDMTLAQKSAWLEQISVLKKSLAAYGGCGKICFEYSIPRIGRYIDAVAIINNVIFVLEFKVNAKKHEPSALDQVCDYALSLKHFHAKSHHSLIAPVLVATQAASTKINIIKTSHNDNLLAPIKANSESLADVIYETLEFADGDNIDADKWYYGRYLPTPTIIEAATDLYRKHQVKNISHSDADATNLGETSDTVADIIKNARDRKHKAICFVTGVPGAGKTLVGLDTATKHLDKENDLRSVLLSGNLPLVDVLREALACDEVQRTKETDNPISKKQALRNVKPFIQRIHNFRDDCLNNKNPPNEHIALFDEAQRVWDQENLADYMKRKKGILDWQQSEPEFLISCLDRHQNWAVIICLVGGGQEIHTGEVGINEWINSVIEKFPHWHVYISSRLTDEEYNTGQSLEKLHKSETQVTTRDELHLNTSIRSFRSEEVSLLVKQILDMNEEMARSTLVSTDKNYPIFLTRDLQKAKQWLRKQARGSERYGMIVSSGAKRLRPHAIDIRPDIKVVNWFLKDKNDVRSSYYLEDVTTEFEIQGLELDWACVTWDADFRYSKQGWDNWRFRGSKWQKIRKETMKIYQKNAYRVLLTRARQGMVIVVPEGDELDPTRKKSYYDPTYEYLKNIGFRLL